MNSSIMSRVDRHKVARQKHERLPYYPKGTGFDWDSFVDKCQNTSGVPFVLQIQKTPEWNEDVFVLGEELPIENLFGITSLRTDGRLGQLCFGRHSATFGGHPNEVASRRIFTVDGFDELFLRTPPKGHGCKVFAMHMDEKTVDKIFLDWLQKMVGRRNEAVPLVSGEVSAMIELRKHLRAFMPYYGNRDFKNRNRDIADVVAYLDERLLQHSKVLAQEIERLESTIAGLRRDIQLLK